MGFKVAFAQTSGLKTAYTFVYNPSVFFSTSGIQIVYPVTKSSVNYFATSGKQVSYPITITDKSFFATSGKQNAFPVVACVNDSKLLKLRLGEFLVATDYSTITAYDATGEYDATTNPYGYNPEADPTNQFRAKRSELDLYLGVRVWKSSTDIPVIFYPGAGDPTLNPWEFTFALNDVFGVYQFYLVGVPVGTPLSVLENHGNSIFDIANCNDGWYITTAGVIAIQEIYQCINKARYKFLESIMCGSCEDDYLAMYSKFVGALSAFDIGTDEAYVQGMTLLEKLLETCNKECCGNSACGDNGC